LGYQLNKEGIAMSKGLIVYFSQGGTTARVAESISAGLGTKGYEVDLHNITDGQPPDPGGYDLLGVGAPAYYYRPPFDVSAYVAGLPDLAGLPAFAFVLYGTYCGDAGNAIRLGLARKGAKEVGYFHCRGADYYTGYLKQGYLFSPDHPTPEELAQAHEYGCQVAARAEGDAYTKPPDDPTLAFIYRFERFITNRLFTQQMYSRLFRVNKQKCTACRICVQECPTGNITEGKEGRPVWSRNCLLCLYCEMRCPEEAITSPVSWPLFTPFIKYNVRHASLDPSLDNVRVTLGQGKVHRS
jgi:flavodoxin/NAD-dependent dihydropyrimidine dehydrogenase PreA subunit